MDGSQVNSLVAMPEKVCAIPHSQKMVLKDIPIFRGTFPALSLSFAGLFLLDQD